MPIYPYQCYICWCNASIWIIGDLEVAFFFFFLGGLIKPIGFCGMWSRMICKPLWLSGVFVDHLFSREKSPLYAYRKSQPLIGLCIQDKNWVFGVTVESQRIWGYHDAQRCALTAVENSFHNRHADSKIYR